jgi:Flagellar hook capping protein
MAVVQEVKDGKFVESSSASSLANDKTKNKSTLDKDAFLGLLVAQMKYQDPLEPTSNTEFVAQYAQFSSLEQMQNMANTMELTRASSMVGKVVVVNTTDSAGRETQIEGRVDYVTYENGKSYVSIDGGLYSLDDVYAIEDQTYLDAVELAQQLMLAIDKLPSMDNFTLDSAEAVTVLKKIYDQMSDYEKSFVSKDYLEKLNEYVARVEELQKDKDENGTGGSGGDSGDDTEKA